MSGQALNLPTCACLLLRVPGTPDDAVRPYTPISEEARLGSFDLLVKRYPEGAASQYLHDMAVGDTVGFKHVAPNVKRQHPFGVRSISMLCAGSGVTPMVQALRKLVGDPSDTTEIVLMVGNKSVEDILMKGELDELVRTSKGRLPLPLTLTLTLTLTRTRTRTRTRTLTLTPTRCVAPRAAYAWCTS